jgi:hypothetical protein
MGADKLVERLEHCKPSGKGRWLARCPAHADKSPSLSIKETSDGRVLVHCFAGCGALDVISALDLEWDDLFPEDLTENYRKTRRQHQYTADELVVEIAKSDMAKGNKLNSEDRQRYQDALLRLYRGSLA